MYSKGPELSLFYLFFLLIFNSQSNLMYKYGINLFTEFFLHKELKVFVADDDYFICKLIDEIELHMRLLMDSAHISHLHIQHLTSAFMSLFTNTNIFAEGKKGENSVHYSTHLIFTTLHYSKFRLIAHAA